MIQQTQTSMYTETCSELWKGEMYNHILFTIQNLASLFEKLIQYSYSSGLMMQLQEFQPT